MKFSCEKALLLTAVNTASRAVSPKSSIPALEGLLLEAQHHLTVSGYNMQTGIRTRVDAEILLREIQEEFPDAFIARERFKYPSMGAPDLRTLTEESSSGQAPRKVGPVPVEGHYSIPYHD